MHAARLRRHAPAMPPAYGGPVGRRDTGGDEQFARLVQAGISRGLDVVEAWRVARQDRPPREIRLARAEHERALAAHQRQIARYRRRRDRLATQSIAGTAVAGVAGTVGVIDVIAEVATAQVGVYGPSWMWLGAAVVGAVVALSSRRARARLAPADESRAPLTPPAALDPDAIGSAEAMRLGRLRTHLAQLVPALQRLHPDAAAELRRADAEAAPPLHALIDRLAILDRIRRDVPGTTAAEAACQAAEEVRARLATGCDTYERLLAASASLLAAPEAARGTDAILGPALQAMSAYAHGLQRSAEALGDDPGRWAP